MKKVLIISSFAFLMLTGTYSFASNSSIVEPTPIVQDDETKAKEGESSETSSECSGKKEECSKDCKKSCCDKEEK